MNEINNNESNVKNKTTIEFSNRVKNIDFDNHIIEYDMMLMKLEYLYHMRLMAERAVPESFIDDMIEVKSFMLKNLEDIEVSDMFTKVIQEAINILSLDSDKNRKQIRMIMTIADANTITHKNGLIEIE